MRYQSPIVNPLAHYWEEDFGRFWSFWLWFRSKAIRSLAGFIYDLIFANIFLLLRTVIRYAVVVPAQSIHVAVAGHIDFGAFAKRTVDVIGSLVGLTLSLPVWIIVPLMIKLDSRGPVLYSQVRVGRDRRRRNCHMIDIERTGDRRISDRRKQPSFGKPFKILKFRSMRQDAEKLSGPIWATKGDNRITRVGRILRKTRIDEVPQLINVLLGDMSIVGPRPERPFFVKRLDGVVKNYIDRFDVKPGITGLAQVEHKYDETIDDVDRKINYDLRYIRNRSIFQDLKIVLKTVVVVLTARGM